MWFTARLNAAPADGGFRRLSLKEYRDKMKGGWIGQIAGVSFEAAYGAESAVHGD